MSKEQPRYSMLIQWSDRDQKYLVRLPEWAHKVQQFVTHGDNYEEAAKNGREVLEMLIENEQEELPEPREAEYKWSAEYEELYKNSDEEPAEFIITGNDDDDVERYQIAAMQSVLKQHITPSGGNVFADLGLPDPQGHLRVAERFRTLGGSGDFATFYQGYKAGEEDTEDALKRIPQQGEVIND